MEIAVPGDFAEAAAPEIPGLALQKPISLARAAGGPGVVAGLVPSGADNAALLPDALAAEIGPEALAARKPVELSGSKLQAFAYEGLQPDGFDGSLTVFAAPSSAGVATVVCYAPADAAFAFKAECESIASSLKLVQGEGLPVGPSVEYAEQLSGILTPLDKAVKAAGPDLRAAKTQASAAAAIAAAYGTAEAAVAKLEPQGADASLNAGLGKALKQSGGAYAKLAAAAKKKSKSAYASAQKAVASANTDLKAALAALAAAGYATS